MDSHRLRWNGPDVEVVGKVADLGVEYAKADAVVIPLFSGSGMKVKTCEALMQGKTVFGTREALTGYEVEGLSSIHCCETADDFVQAILMWSSLHPRPRFDPAVRHRYEERYSPAVTLAGYHEAFFRMVQR
jgi:polysaccharide biosynthesis protein PslH